MATKDKKVNWDIFKLKFSGRETSEFERMGMLLFCAETDNRIGLFRFKNQPGIEANPIMYQGKLTGHQSKYYTTSLGNNKADLIDSLKKSKKLYPGLEVVYVYTNCEPGYNIKSPDLKPSYMVEIDNAAKNLGLLLEWRLPSHLEVQLARPENEYIYEIFFSDDSTLSDLIDSVNNHNDSLLLSVKDRILFHEREIRINRDKLSDEILQTVNNKGITILVGEGGSGKTALLKDIYQKYSGKQPFCIFKASEFNVKNPDDVLNWNVKHTFNDLIRAYDDTDTKVFVIDSAERLAEIDNLDMLQQMLHLLNNNGWSILFITRNVYFKDLSTFIHDYIGLSISVCEVPLLGADELSKITTHLNIKLPANERFTSRLSNLFYLDQYINHYDEIDLKGSYREFIDLLWEKKIRGLAKSRNQDNIRDKCIITIAQKRADNGTFFIDCSDLDGNALSSLVTDEIISHDAVSNGYFLTHDIYEEWALDKIVRRAWANSENSSCFFDTIGESLPMRRAFRMWLTEELRGTDTGWHEIVGDAFSHRSKASFWIDEILISIMLSNSAEKFFSKFEDLIVSDDFSLLIRVLFLLRLACVKSEGTVYSKDIPVGSGWVSVISFIYKHKNEFLVEHSEQVVPIMKIWSSVYPHGTTTQMIGELALYVINNEINQKRYCNSKVSDDLIFVLFNCAYEIKNELCELANKAIADNHSNRNKIVEKIWETLIHKPHFALPVLTVLPKEVLSICENFWIEEEADETEGHQPFFHHRNEFGLSFLGQERHFPASANQTPLLFLLSCQPDLTIDFIIKFVNRTVSLYKKSGKDKSLKEVEVHLPDSINKQLFSRGLWECYRGIGTPVMPNLLQSMHMALEKYLLKLPVSDKLDRVRNILLKILYQSKSASLTAVVTSVVLKYPDRLYDIASIIFSTPEFIDADCRRRVNEDRVESLYRIGYGIDRIRDLLYTDERLATCKESHRKNTIEHVILSYQIGHIRSLSDSDHKRFVEKIHKIIDGYKSDERIMSYMSNIIERIDSRNVRMEILDKKDNEIYVKFVPKERSQQSIESAEKALAQMNEITKYSSLMMWASDYKTSRRENESMESEYDENFHKAVVELKELIKDLNAGNPCIMQMYNSLPYMVASKLLRKYATSLSEEDKHLCKDLILQCVSSIFHESYYYQIGDGSEAAFLALPVIMREFPNLQEEIISVIVLSLLRVPGRGGWMNTFDKSKELFLNTRLWETDPVIAETIVATYLDIQNLISHNPDTVYDIVNEYSFEPKELNPETLDCREIYTLDTALHLLPIDCSHERVMAMYEKIFAHIPEKFFMDNPYHDEDKNYAYSSMAYAEVRTSVFSKLAALLLTIENSEETAILLEFLKKKMTSSNATSSFIEALISAECQIGSVNQFKKIWKSLYEVVVSLKSSNKRHSYDNIVSNYLLAWPYWVDGIKQWDSFDCDIIWIYEKSAADLWDCEKTLYSFGKVFTSIGSKYIDEGLDCIYCLIDKQVTHHIIATNPDTIFYLEKFMNMYCIQRWEHVKKDRRINKKVRIILKYLVSCGSAKAFRQLDLI